MNPHEPHKANPEPNTRPNVVETRDRRDDEWDFAFHARVEYDRDVELSFEDLIGLKEEFVVGFDETPIVTHEKQPHPGREASCCSYRED